MRRGRMYWVTVLAGACLPFSVARGVDFIFTPSASMSQEQIDAFKVAGQRWSANLTNPITVNINIDFAPLGDNILAQTSSTEFTYAFSNVRSWMSSAATSADDRAAVAHVPTGTSFNLLINLTSNNPAGSGSSTPYVDSNASGFSSNNKRITLTQANLKALGQSGSGSDATITFNSKYTYDYNPRDGMSAGAFDFVGLATHEIGHALGFNSGVDRLDSYFGAATPPSENSLPYVMPLDLFRYSSDSAAKGVIDWTADTRDKYFSLDGGATKIASFSTGINAGDGSQASHWKEGQNLGVMGPSAAPRSVLRITDLDRQAMDVIGYGLNMTYSWAETAGGTWANAINWNTASVPSQAIDTVFNQAATYQVNFIAASQVKSVRIAAGSVTFNLAGQAMSVAGDLSIGDAATGAPVLAVAGPGTLSTQSLYVGGNSTAARVAGTLTIGAGTTVDVADTLRVWNVPGAVLTNNGGVLSAANIINAGTFNHASGVLAVTTSFTNSGGTANIGGTQSWGHASSLIVSGGTVNLSSDAGNIASAPLAVSIGAAGKLGLKSSQHLASLAITGGQAIMDSGADKVLLTRAISIDPAGLLDLADNSMIVQADATTRTDAYSSMRTLVQTARHGGAWDRPGLTSSAALANPALGVAVILNDRGDGAPLLGSLLGQSVDANSVIAAATWNGDTDLNGVIDADDYFRIDQGLLRGGSSWRDGDFNYDGVVGLDDYNLIDAAWLAQSRATGSPLLMSVANAVVPEPGLLGPLILPLLALRRRRRACRMTHLVPAGSPRSVLIH